MFSFFKSSKQKTNSNLKLEDLYHNSLNEGDMVHSLRYDMGKCKVVKTEKGIEYESLETGETVHWTLMIDAATELQKVKKVLD